MGWMLAGIGSVLDDEAGVGAAEGNSDIVGEDCIKHHSSLDSKLNFRLSSGEMGVAPLYSNPYDTAT